MQLSVWQQFSSNHSGGFTLVGEFKTAEAAQKAYDTVWDFILKIAAYYHEHPEWAQTVLSRPAPLSPVEKALAKEYDLKHWELTVDWADAAYDKPRLIGDRQVNMYNGLKIYENILFLNEFTDTWLDMRPFDDLFQKLGGKIEYSVVEVSETAPVINVSCSAGSAEKAAELVQTIASSGITLGNMRVPTVQLADDTFFEGTVSHRGSNITIQELPISSWLAGSSKRIEDFLPKLTAYLKEKGCTNIEYSLASKAYGE